MLAKQYFMWKLIKVTLLNPQSFSYWSSNLPACRMVGADLSVYTDKEINFLHVNEIVAEVEGLVTQM